MSSTPMANLALHKLLIPLLLPIFLSTGSGVEEGVASAAFLPVTTGEFLPAESTQYKVIPHDSSDRRRLVPFQLCLPCRCCAVNSVSNCTIMSCCFGIDCQLPNKPFGVCAFAPNTCGCNACGGGA